MAKHIIRKFSAGGVVHSDGKFLTIKWLSEGTVELPKGTVEEGETPEQACIREILEETGYNVKIVELLMVSTFMFDWKDGNKYKKTVHYYLAERIDNLQSVPRREDNEDFENDWLNAKDAYEALSFDDMKVALKKAADLVSIK
jgi:8-oxo-dGTP diphosphatase